MNQRTNSEWLSDLQGADKESAIADLREILVRGLSFTLIKRIRNPDVDLLVEDFVQEALIKILDNLDTFRGESKFTTWAQKIAVRVAYTELRRARWKDISIEDLLPEGDYVDFTPAILSDPSPDPEQRITQINMAEVVQRIINEELTERQRVAILAVMAGNMPMEEVARRMDTNRNALYKLIHDARKRIQSHLQVEGLSPEEILGVFDQSG
jgi:RNA polymerase sigma-70 factor (ECF subfamily)